MNETFNRAYGFSADVGDWDVSAVTDMYMMFYKCNTFDHDLNGWDVSGVTNMVKMFRDCYSFNGDVSDWDVSSVTDMEAMFEYAYAFNADLSGWDVSSVTSFEDAFYYALSFEGGDLSRWDVSNAKNMYEMFGYGVSFDGFLSGWDVSSVTDFEYMFEDAYVFRGIGLEDWTFNATYTDSDSYASDQVHNIGLWWNKKFIGDITNWPMAPEFSVYDLNRRAYDCGNLGDVSTCTMQGCLAEEMGGVHIPHGTPGDCGDADLDHKDTCTPTCDAGYEAAGDVMCYGSYAISTFSCQPIMTCTGADAAPDNGDKGDCPASLADREDCTPACNSGYTGYGARFCS
jgi:surface protein